jgi:hypothetical protein
MPVIPALGMLRKIPKFKASPGLETSESCLKKIIK